MGRMGECRNIRNKYYRVSKNVKLFKGLSNCHEFGYDMRRVNNSPHVVGKSKRCRHISAVVVHYRHISYIVGECLRDLSRHNTASKVGGAISRTELATHPLSYRCRIHCRLLSWVFARSRRPKQLPSDCGFTTGYV